jgi:molecular chaperone GrpE
MVASQVASNDAEALAQVHAELANCKPKVASWPTSTCAPRPMPKIRADAPKMKSPKPANSRSRVSPKACCRSPTALEAGLLIKDATADQIREGAQATLRQLIAALERNKVWPLPPPQAPSSTPTNTRPSAWCPPSKKPTRWWVLQKGYSIADRVLRPALVTVSAPK